MIAFEFDSEKSRSNNAKHGMDFIEAQKLWDDPDRIEIPVFATDEPRWLTIGKISGKTWTAVITNRGENIRIISVRRSRKNEVMLYENDNSKRI
ncbi:MAG: BrnT family toxin [Pseudomonadota bacterium]